jgi:hypothetical protein
MSGPSKRLEGHGDEGRSSMEGLEQQSTSRMTATEAVDAARLEARRAESRARSWSRDPREDITDLYANTAPVVRQLNPTGIDFQQSIGEEMHRDRQRDWGRERVEERMERDRAEREEKERENKVRLAQHRERAREAMEREREDERRSTGRVPQLEQRPHRTQTFDSTEAPVPSSGPLRPEAVGYTPAGFVPYGSEPLQDPSSPFYSDPVTYAANQARPVTLAELLRPPAAPCDDDTAPTATLSVVRNPRPVPTLSTAPPPPVVYLPIAAPHPPQTASGPHKTFGELHQAQVSEAAAAQQREQQQLSAHQHQHQQQNSHRSALFGTAPSSSQGRHSIDISHAQASMSCQQSGNYGAPLSSATTAPYSMETDCEPGRVLLREDNTLDFAAMGIDVSALGLESPPFSQGQQQLFPSPTREEFPIPRPPSPPYPHLMAPELQAAARTNLSASQRSIRPLPSSSVGAPAFRPSAPPHPSSSHPSPPPHPSYPPRRQLHSRSAGGGGPPVEVNVSLPPPSKKRSVYVPYPVPPEHLPPEHRDYLGRSSGAPLSEGQWAATRAMSPPMSPPLLSTASSSSSAFNAPPYHPPTSHHQNYRQQSQHFLPYSPDEVQVDLPAFDQSRRMSQVVERASYAGDAEMDGAFLSLSFLPPRTRLIRL